MSRRHKMSETDVKAANRVLHSPGSWPADANPRCERSVEIDRGIIVAGLVFEANQRENSLSGANSGNFGEHLQLIVNNELTCFLRVFDAQSCQNRKTVFQLINN